MKKLLKSEICGSMNSARDPHVAENWLKSQTFQLKKKGRNANVHLESALHPKKKKKIIELLNA